MRFPPAVTALVCFVILGFAPVFQFVASAEEPDYAPPKVPESPEADVSPKASVTPKAVTSPKAPGAWTFEEAVAAWEMDRKNAYLNYVMFALAKIKGEKVPGADDREVDWMGNERRPDLMSVMTGAAAIQESLQIDTLRGEDAEKEAVVELLQGSGTALTLEEEDRAKTSQEAEKRFEAMLKERTAIGDLAGPGAKAHPWKEMLAERKKAGVEPIVSPLAVSPLAGAVPADQYYVRFPSIDALLNAIDLGEVWGGYFTRQGARTSESRDAAAKIKQQLAVRTDPLSRPFYGAVVEEVALTGSDLFLGEGSDVAILFRLKARAVFETRMAMFLEEAAKADGAVRDKGEVEGIPYESVVTPDGAVRVFSAYPQDDLHIRANSKEGLARILRALSGKTASLGSTDELKYIRTLMPGNSEDEDAFIYLSDPFIRRMTSAELKITELRRRKCFNNLRMLDHASLLFRTQYGRTPKSIPEMRAHGCLPVAVGAESGNDGDESLAPLRCPCGGELSLSADGKFGVCSVHGRSNWMTPCVEIPVKEATGVEAFLYKNFVQEYDEYWRTYFDPVAVRLSIGEEKYVAETIILPLIENSIYSSVKSAIDGKCQSIAPVPTLPQTVFSVTIGLNPELLNMTRDESGHLFLFESAEKTEGASESENESESESETAELERRVEEFLTKGIALQPSFHLCDCDPGLDFGPAGLVGSVLNPGGDSLGVFLFGIQYAVIGTAVIAPAYVSVPVKDEAIVEGVFDLIDDLAVKYSRNTGGTVDFFSFDFSKTTQSPGSPRSLIFEIGPIKWRLFLAHSSKNIFIANKAELIEQLIALDRENNGAAQPDRAHAMLRFRPEAWSKLLSNCYRGWAETNRRACQTNQAPLAAVARALVSTNPGRRPTTEEVVKEFTTLFSRRPFCAEGGAYVVSEDGKSVNCPIHGGPGESFQPPKPSDDSAQMRWLRDTKSVQVRLLLLEDGLHTFFEVERAKR